MIISNATKNMPRLKFNKYQTLSRFEIKTSYNLLFTLYQKLLKL